MILGSNVTTTIFFCLDPSSGPAQSPYRRQFLPKKFFSPRNEKIVQKALCWGALGDIVLGTSVCAAFVLGRPAGPAQTASHLQLVKKSKKSPQKKKKQKISHFTLGPETWEPWQGPRLVAGGCWGRPLVRVCFGGTPEKNWAVEFFFNPIYIYIYISSLGLR